MIMLVLSLMSAIGKLGSRAEPKNGLTGIAFTSGDSPVFKVTSSSSIGSYVSFCLGLTRLERLT
jgi:hypothetical protein